MAKILPVKFGSGTLPLVLGKKRLEVFRASNGIRLISIRTASKALGYDGKSKDWPFEFAAHLNRLTPVDPVLLESLSQKLAADDNSRLVPVVMAKDFLKLCHTVMEANAQGFLFQSEQKFARAAAEMLQFFEARKLPAMIDFTTGYDRFKQNHKSLVSDRMQARYAANYPIWVKTLSDDFFEVLFAYQNDAWEDLNRQSDKYSAMLNDMIFTRLDDALFESLELSKPRMRYSRPFEVETYKIHPQLQAYIVELAALLRASSLNAPILKQMLAKRFPTKRQIKTVQTAAEAKPLNPGLAEHLQIAVSKKN